MMRDVADNICRTLVRGDTTFLGGGGGGGITLDDTISPDDTTLPDTTTPTRLRWHRLPLRISDRICDQQHLSA